MAPPGLMALGAKGSVRDRLTPPGRVEGFRPRELYSIAALARYGAFGASINAAFGGENRTAGLRPKENHTTALAGVEMHSPFGGWRHHLSPASGGTITRAYGRARKCTPFGGWRHHLPPGGGALFFAMR